MNIKMIALSLVLILFVACFPAAADGVVSARFSTTEIQSGDLVTLSITVTAPSAFQAVSFQVLFDTAGLAYVSGENTNCPADGRVVFVNATNGTSVTASIVFRGISVGETTVHVADVCYSDGNGEVFCGDAVQTIAITRATSGDCNGDGEIDITDLALLKRSLAGDTVALEQQYADYNGDGGVDITDLALLKLKLAGIDPGL